MDNTEELRTLSSEMISEVNLRIDPQNGDDAEQIAFTELMIQYLTEESDLDDGVAFSYKRPNIQVNGYSFGCNPDSIDIFISFYSTQYPAPTLSASQADILYNRAFNFIEKCMTQKYFQNIQKASPAMDLALTLDELKDSLLFVKIYLLTNTRANILDIPIRKINNAEVSFQTWDLIRTQRLLTSGEGNEVLEIDFEEEFSILIPCLQVPCDVAEYSACLAVFPGEILADLYQRFGGRLLEKNVRAFLQARGKVNKGINTTIKEAPHMFLAYNNGISITAEDIEYAIMDNGAIGIKKLRDLQIVNGGQTTASLLYAQKNNNADLSKVFVQAKISVITDSSTMEQIVPDISKYANSQNKINEADFSANLPFHVKIEEFSRSTWTPDSSSKWFYERSRGQYNDARAKCSTPARRKKFAEEYPSAQKITKTDLAKYENTWMQMPYCVSLGAEKNFRDFTIQLGERKGFIPDEEFYRKLIAKAILFKSTEKIVSKQGVPGYRANIVTYTLALLNHLTAQRINLLAIWQKQSISIALEKCIDALSRLVRERIMDSANGRNITEWCKKTKCWDDIKTIEFSIPATLQAELIPVGKNAKITIDQGITGADADDKNLIEKISAISAETWFAISNWGKNTEQLASWERGIAFSIGKVLARGQQPSRKQALHGEKILEKVKNAGLRV